MVQELLLREVVEVTDRLRQSLTAQTTHEDFSDRLNETLNSILPPRFRATRSTITDGMGHSTPELLAVVYDTEKFDATGAASVPANAAVAAFSGHATLDARWFEVAYEEIVTVKSLIKDEPSATASGFHPSNVTLGIIIGLDSAEPVERLGEQTDRLNRRHASRQWPDLVVIIERGTVNFAIQFPGEGIIGDFLPPSQGDFLLLPAYIHLFARPTGESGLARLCSHLFMHLWTWTGSIVRNMQRLMESMPKIGLTICAYQFNLSRQLIPLREEEYISSTFSGSVPVRIEGPDGDLLGHVRFLPWQDGGAIQLTGKLPLEGILIFLGHREGMSTINTKTGQISSVLPITSRDFEAMIRRIQRQGNFQIRPEKAPRWVTSQVANEGSSTPSYARLYSGTLGLRDQALPPGQQRKDFDTAYEAVLNALESAREAFKEMKAAVKTHAEKLTTGEIVSFDGQHVNISDNIDRILRREIESFLNSAVRAIKDGLQAVLAGFDLKIGFLFQQQQSFDKAIEKPRLTDPVLAVYLQATRAHWSETLVTTRNELHGTWIWPRASYNVDEENKAAAMVEPQIKGIAVTTFVSQMLDRVCCFVEEIVTFALSKQLPQFIWVTQIPIGNRKPALPTSVRACSPRRRINSVATDCYDFAIR